MEEKTVKVHLDTLPFESKGRAVALGYFDGLHEGHLEIIKKTVKSAKQLGLISTVQTFTGFPKYGGRCLTTVDERIDILSGMGVDELLVLNFTDDLKNMLPIDFYTTVLRHSLNAKVIITGDDYRFGKDQSGNPDLLKEICTRDGIAYRMMPPRTDRESGRRISSTWLREALEKGDVTSIASLCGGRPISYQGRVVRGKMLGRQLGFPTVNIEIPDNKASIRHGVYASRILLGKQVLYGVSNIGRRPTVETSDNDILETHIFGFDEDIYGANIKVELLSFLRPEKKFASEDELVEAIRENKEQAQQFFEDSGIIIN